VEQDSDQKGRRSLKRVGCLIGGTPIEPENFPSCRNPRSAPTFKGNRQTVDIQPMRHCTLTLSAFLLLFVPLFASDSEAQTRRRGWVICERSSNGALVVRRMCHPKQTRVFDPTMFEGQQGERGEKGEQGEQGPIGLTGPQGSVGESGALGIYGDGSAGDLDLTDVNQLDGSGSFHNIVVPVGANLMIPSGVTLRCTGSFINNGTIEIEPFASGAYQSNNDGSFSHLGHRPAGAGLSFGGAANGAAGTGGGNPIPGAQPTVALSSLTLRSLLSPGPNGGGGGGALGFTTYELDGINSVEGGSGGGTLRIICRDGIFNNGTISANGTSGIGSGVGGGAGGVIILASAQEIVNDGMIQANGAAGIGAHRPQLISGGGGGGGGLVHLLSPSPDNGNGDITVTGGAGGASNPGSIPALEASSGGAGGSLAGAGGAGGQIDNDVNSGENGEAGLVLMTTVAEPAYLF